MLAAAPSSIPSGIALILLGIAMLAGATYFYRRATRIGAKVPGTIKWGAGLLVVQGFLVYLAVLLAAGGVAVAQSPLEVAFELALAAADITFGVGLYSRKRWAWIGALVAQGVGAAVAFFIDWPSVSSIVASAIYPLVVVVLLSLQSSRSWVASGSPTPNS